MTTQDESNDQQRPGHSSNAPEAKGGKRRLFLLIGLLALALFALWYDYKVARPAVEQAYDRIAATNDEINSAAEHRRMTSADVKSALERSPSETFLNGKYTIERYRWSAGMPIELRGLNGDESPGIGLKTHDYYAVYRQDGQELAFVTHFKFDLDNDYFVEKVAVAAAGDSASAEEGMMMGGGGPGGPGMGMMGGPGGGPGGPGGGGGPGGDPEAFFAERDADADGKLAGEEISERMRGRLEAIDTDGDGAVSKEEFLAARSQAGGPGGGPGRGPGGEGEGRPQRPALETSDDAPAAEATTSDASAAAESKEAPADTTTEKPATEKPATEPAAEAAPEASEETAKEESGSES